MYIQLLRERTNANLLNLMKIASNSGLAFNSRKCQTKFPEVTFLGTIFIKGGEKPDPQKIQGIRHAPSDVQKL